MFIYLDESGDLGFSSESPTGFFTIAFIAPEDPVRMKRCVRRVKVKYGIPSSAELKGAATRPEIKQDLLSRLAQLPIEVHASTVRKANVDEKLRRDTNILYNYMVGLSLVERILEAPPNSTVTVTVDRRITATTAGFNFDKYVRYKVWYEKGRRDIEIRLAHVDSHQSLGVQAIDIVCNTVFRHHQRGETALLDVIRPKIRTDKKLFW